MDDLISRKALLKECAECQKTDPRFEERGWASHFLNDAGEPSTEWYCVEDIIENAPAVDAAPVVRCRDCLFFVVKDHWAEWNGIPILAASDCPTCTKWGGADGCMTKPDGYCFMGEPKEAENGTDHNP